MTTPVRALRCNFVEQADIREPHSSSTTDELHDDIGNEQACDSQQPPQAAGQ